MDKQVSKWGLNNELAQVHTKTKEFLKKMEAHSVELL